MSYFESDERIELTEDVFSNFTSSSEDFEDYKTAEEYREERLAAQAEKKKKKKRERRSKLLNNLMPAAAMALLVCTVSYMNSLQFGLVISYNDEQIATVENADVVEEATDIINNKIILKSLDSMEAQPQYRVAIINNNSDVQNSTELSRSILANDNVLEDEICGVFVDGTFVGATATQEEAQKVLDSILSEKKSSCKDMGSVTSVEFNSGVSLEVGLYAKSSIVDSDTLKDRLLNNVELSYKVTASEKRNVKIKYKTEYVVDSSKPSGYEEVKTQGVLGEGFAEYSVAYLDGVQISEERTKVTASKKPVNEVIIVSSDNENADNAKRIEDLDTDSDKTKTAEDNSKSTDTDTKSEEKSENSSNTTNTSTDKSSGSESESKASAQSNNSGFIWPAQSCYTVTREFGYEGEKLHKGIDISGAGVEGTPIVASASGYVTTAVIDYGSENYGCYLIIDHGNGYQTLYAQCSDIYVAPGTYVEQGETIAAVGSTGDSTGAHLHFEIICNGEYVNPACYLY